MSRLFSGSNEEVRYPIQTASNFTGAWSMALWVDFAGSNNTWQSLLVHHLSTGLYGCGLERAGPGGTTDLLAVEVSGFNTQYAGPTLQAADGWLLVGASKAAGNSQPRVHILKGGSWTHATTAGAWGNSPSQTGGSIRLGEFEDADDLNGYVAADAGWAANLNDAAFEALTVDLNTWVGHATAPAYVHQHNQANASDDILDLMGNGHDATGTITSTTDSTGIAGTTMDSNNPSGIVFVGAATAAIPHLVMAPPIPA